MPGRSKEIGHPDVQITATEVRTAISKKKQWVAAITGRHPTFHFQRTFCLRAWVSTYVYAYRLCGQGVYEFRGLGSSGDWSGFFRVYDDATVEEIDANEAMSLVVDIVTRMAHLGGENFDGPPPPF